jgi:hypothetical protein
VLPDPIVRRAVAGALAVLVLAGCGSSSATTVSADHPTTGRPTSTEHDADVGEGPGRGPCTSVPPAPSPAVNVAWVPSDLSLPAGTYAVRDLDAGGPTATHRVVFVVPGTLTDFVRFAIASWPGPGWRLGRGEGENGEREDTFSRGAVRGRFRVRSAYCDGDRTELLLQLTSA